MVTPPFRFARCWVVAASLSASIPAGATELDMRDMQSLSQQLKSNSLNLDDQVLIDGTRKRAQERADQDTAWIGDVQKKRQEQVAELIRNGSLPIGGASEASGEQAGNSKPFPNRAVEQGPVTYVLVSWSMPRAELLEIMDRMQGQNAAIVFRGIPKSTTMLDALEQMNSLTVESKSEVSVLIDPFLFQRTNTEVVPTVVKEENQKLIAKVSGLSTTDYLEQAISEGKSGDLGVRGPTLSILEPDFMSVVQERIEKLDFEEMKTKALARYWKNKKLEILPTATEHDVRHVDASVILPSDITTPNGDVVARAGSINPLKLRKFTQRVVFIDATSSWQVEFAKKQVDEFKSKQRVTVITTNVDADDGWSTFGKTSDYIGARIGLLDEGLKNRFQIQKTPSVLTANDSDFIVEEFPEASAEGAQL